MTTTSVIKSKRNSKTILKNKTNENVAKIFIPLVPCTHDSLFDLVDPIVWERIIKQDMDLDYAIIFQKQSADKIFQQLENEIEYYTGNLSKVHVYNKWYDIPRKQVN
jgi:hypothetical protein